MSACVDEKIFSGGRKLCESALHRDRAKKILALTRILDLQGNNTPVSNFQSADKFSLKFKSDVTGESRRYQDVDRSDLLARLNKSPRLVGAILSVGKFYFWY